MAGFDLSGLGEKRAVNIVLFMGVFTPGVLYLYFKNPSLYQSLDTAKIFLFSLSIGTLILILNLSISTIISYMTFTTKRYREGNRLKEEVINRIGITSGLFSSSIFLNSAFIALYVSNYNLKTHLIVAGIILDIVLVIFFTCLIRRKVNLDLFYHKFPG